MTLKKLKKDTNTKDALDFLRKKHYHYFIPKVIDEGQVESKAYLKYRINREIKNGITRRFKIANERR